MSSLLFAFKRCLRSPGYVSVLLLCAAAIFLSCLSGASGAVPPAGVCDLDGSEQSRRIVDYLTDNGFAEFNNASDMEALVAGGELDCAVVLPEGLSEMIASGELEGALRFVSSPSSFTPGLYRSTAAAALFREHAPYVTADALSDSGLSEEAVLERYFSMFETGPAFAFDVVSASGAAIPENSSSRAIAMGALSLLLMALLLSAAAGLTGQGFRTVCSRLGFAAAMKKVLVPGLLSRTVLAAAAASAGLLTAAAFGCGYALSLIAPAMIYCVLMSALAMLLCSGLPRPRHMLALLPLLLIASLALSPVFTDITLFSPLLAALRSAIPGYWFWLVAEKPLLWLLISALALPLTVILFALRFYVGGKYRLRPLK